MSIVRWGVNRGSPATATAWVDHEDVELIESSQLPRDKYCMIPFMRHLKRPHHRLGHRTVAAEGWARQVELVFHIYRVPDSQDSEVLAICFTTLSIDLALLKCTL